MNEEFSQLAYNDQGNRAKSFALDHLACVFRLLCKGYENNDVF